MFAVVRGELFLWKNRGHDLGPRWEGQGNFWRYFNKKAAAQMGEEVMKGRIFGFHSMFLRLQNFRVLKPRMTNDAWEGDMWFGEKERSERVALTFELKFLDLGRMSLGRRAAVHKVRAAVKYRRCTSSESGRNHWRWSQSSKCC